MKKYLYATFFITTLIFGSFLFLNIKVSYADLSIDSLVKRIMFLEKKVTELFEEIAKIQLIPGPPGPEGPVGPKGEPGENGSSLHLLDANNQDLGLLAFAGDIDNLFNSIQYSTYFKLNDGNEVMFSFVNKPNQIAFRDKESVYQIFFSELDCEGESFINANILPNSGQKIFSFNDTVGNFIIRLDTRSMRQSKSRLESGSSGNIFCSHNEGTIDSYLKTDITMPFSEPLAWPLKISVE